MYSKQTVYDAHLKSKKHVKAAAREAEAGRPPENPNGPPADGANGSGHHNGTDATNKHRTAALLTHLSTKLLAALAPVLNDTKSNVERRFSLTAREREQELLEQSKPKPPPAPAKKEGAEEEEEEEERIYNPLKLPLGWDGKPIPYWLYKLHGLGVEYRCEICSDHVYMGRCVHAVITRFRWLKQACFRKNFDRHFQVSSARHLGRIVTDDLQESRHAFGMRALGLPNTKHFHEITRIEDALACTTVLSSLRCHR